MIKLKQKREFSPHRWWQSGKSRGRRATECHPCTFYPKYKILVPFVQNIKSLQNIDIFIQNVLTLDDHLRWCKMVLMKYFLQTCYWERPGRPRHNTLAVPPRSDHSCLWHRQAWSQGQVYPHDWEEGLWCLVVLPASLLSIVIVWLSLAQLPSPAPERSPVIGANCPNSIAE